jgi:hypothetical protein
MILFDLTLPGAPSNEVIMEAQRIRPGVMVIHFGRVTRKP